MLEVQFHVRSGSLNLLKMHVHKLMHSRPDSLAAAGGKQPQSKSLRTTIMHTLFRAEAGRNTTLILTRALNLSLKLTTARRVDELHCM